MSRAAFVLIGPRSRSEVCSLVSRAPDFSRVEIKGPQRSLDQNSKLWPMLTDVARSKPGGRLHTPDQWKVLFLHAIGREVQFLPALEGTGFIPWGQSSSDLSVGEMAELITFIQAWGDQNGVAWSERERVAA